MSRTIPPQNNPALKAERRRQIWSLFLGGMTNQSEIARQLGVAKVTVHKHIHAVLDELAAQDLADAGQYRTAELARLDQQLASIAAEAFNKAIRLADRLHAHEVMLKIADRRAKLLGLDKPLKVAETDTEGNDRPQMTAEEYRREVEAILAADQRGTG